MHLDMLDRMFSMVFQYVDMMPVGRCGLSPVWGLRLVEISSNDC